MTTIRDFSRSTIWNEVYNFFCLVLTAASEEGGRNLNLRYGNDSVESLQGGHEMMDLATGMTFTSPCIKSCTMTHMVVERVELLAEKQG